MIKIAVIPARFGATRFPGKLMEKIGGKTVILKTYEAVKETNLFDDVFVICDSEIIYNEISSNGGKAIKSIKEHETGSDRIAEAVENIEADVVVNVQGDEPFTKKEPLSKLLEVFQKDEEKDIDLATLKQEITDWKNINDPNVVKVIADKNDSVMYFSRSPIPYPRDKDILTKYFRHIGIYAFRKKALLDFTQMPILPLEAAEKIEGIRFLEHGMKMKIVETDNMGIGIDTPEDLQKAREYWEGLNKIEK